MIDADLATEGDARDLFDHIYGADAMSYDKLLESIYNRANAIRTLATQAQHSELAGLAGQILDLIECRWAELVVEPTDYDLDPGKACQPD